MKKNLLCVHPGFGEPYKLFKEAMKRKETSLVRQVDLVQSDIEKATALITNGGLDQVDFMQYSGVLEDFLLRGGRWYFTGHMMRPLVFGLQNFVVVAERGLPGLKLTPLADHPTFEGVVRSNLDTVLTIGGIYGRGHNPMPEGAKPITGIGSDNAPIDWEWSFGGGGKMFSHAGIEVLNSSQIEEETQRLADNIINWTLAKEAS